MFLQSPSIIDFCLCAINNDFPFEAEFLFAVEGEVFGEEALKRLDTDGDDGALK